MAGRPTVRRTEQRMIRGGILTYSTNHQSTRSFIRSFVIHTSIPSPINLQSATSRRGLFFASIQNRKTRRVLSLSSPPSVLLLLHHHHPLLTFTILRGFDRQYPCRYRYSPETYLSRSLNTRMEVLKTLMAYSLPWKIIADTTTRDTTRKKNFVRYRDKMHHTWHPPPEQ